MQKKNLASSIALTSAVSGNFQAVMLPSGQGAAALQPAQAIAEPGIGKAAQPVLSSPKAGPHENLVLQSKLAGNHSERGREGRGERRGRRDREEKDSDLIDKLVHINRVTKVVKGGRRFGFAALVVVGDGKGRVGFGHGKAREVPEAIRKATEDAKRSMIKIPLKDGRTLHHDLRGHHGAGKVLVRPAPAGTGIIAGGPMRAVFEALGVGDVVSKSLGSSNPYNMVRATFDALKGQQSPRMVAQRRGRKVSDILAHGEHARATVEA